MQKYILMIQQYKLLYLYIVISAMIELTVITQNYSWQDSKLGVCWPQAGMHLLSWNYIVHKCCLLTRTVITTEIKLFNQLNNCYNFPVSLCGTCSSIVWMDVAPVTKHIVSAFKGEKGGTAFIHFTRGAIWILGR